MSFKDISNINNKIVQQVRELEIYNNEQSERKWKTQLANIIFCYYGRDEFNIINSNYICNTTWIDETQDRNWWYKLSGNSEVINDVLFKFHSYHETLKIFQQKNTGEKNTLIYQTKEIISHLISLAEKVIGIYNEFLNETKTEKEFIQEINKLTPLIDKWYFTESELDIPPKEIKKWCSTCTALAGTIHDFTLFYNEKALATRSFNNRIACMNITKDRYYEDLETLRIEEQQISSSII